MYIYIRHSFGGFYVIKNSEGIMYRILIAVRVLWKPEGIYIMRNL